MTKRRLLSICVLCVSLFFLPWWATVVFSLGFLLLFSTPYEVIAVGFFLDYLYRIPSDSFVRSHIFFLTGGLLVLLSYLIKEHFTFELY